MHHPVGSAVNVLRPVGTGAVFKGAAVLVCGAQGGGFIRQVKTVVGVVTDLVPVNTGP